MCVPGETIVNHVNPVCVPGETSVNHVNPVCVPGETSTLSCRSLRASLSWSLWVKQTPRPASESPFSVWRERSPAPGRPERSPEGGVGGGPVGDTDLMSHGENQVPFDGA